MPTLHYDSYSSARERFKDVLDAAENGAVVTVRRDAATAAVVDARRLRHFLASVVPPCVQLVAEADGWSAFIPGLPIAAAAADFDDVISDVLDALREYAEDWPRLQHAPNHRENWGLVQLVTLSDDDQLRKWITAAER